MHTDDELAALAREHLPADVAERWLALCRPAVGLVPLPVGDVLTTVAGHLGGEPALPDDVPWPVTGDGRPLYHLATIDCEAAGLPAQGRLVFFVDEALFEYDVADTDDLDDDEDEPPAPDAARLVHVPGGTPVRPRATPARGYAYGRTRLGARPCATAPAADHPLVRREFGDAVTAPGHPLNALGFARALAAREPEHRVGGHPSALRRSVAYDVAGDPLDWEQLAQFDRSDADIAWHGDDGVLLHWLMRADDLAAARFDRAVFTLRRPYRNVG
ncbi:YwqG family protein [Dactylosporangium sp. AC04546]|uniref:DUF1963 domain-containing protein n=1 Tax=Dactylosporangium sp. AC04546 TaxID=2862460 RepID=UPI001EDE6A6A|nr:YwqG family protein [Dactylosporangium sp. AC04546]WVK79114.1 YwqG family protein [Dactylosporangium sp. AC04546]